MPPSPSCGPKLPCFQGCLQQTTSNAQCPHPSGHAPEPECPNLGLKPSPLLEIVPVSVSNNPYPRYICLLRFSPGFWVTLVLG